MVARRMIVGGRCLGLAGALALVLLWPVAAMAQKPPLGEVARKEQERRKAAATSQRVLTNKDLPDAALRPVPAPPSGGAEAAPLDQPPALPAPDPDTKDDEEEKDEAWWRARIAQATDGVRRNDILLEALQSRVNALATDFVSRDDPYQRARIADDRQKALAEMERVRTETESLKKQIEDIEEEARRAGVPPGWLR